MIERAAKRTDFACSLKTLAVLIFVDPERAIEIAFTVKSALTTDQKVQASLQPQDERLHVLLH